MPDTINTAPRQKSVPPPSATDVRALLEDQQRQITELREMTRTIYNYVWWSRVMVGVKVLLIAIPIILGILYLPPLIENAFSPYQGLLGDGGDDSTFRYRELLDAAQ